MSNIRDTEKSGNQQKPNQPQHGGDHRNQGQQGQDLGKRGQEQQGGQRDTREDTRRDGGQR
ncbi:hypothetical protein [Aestuariivirga sp.]|uniref:hypothetical protein n=1 Tax=Aestuariivirga sp. TaxID=2650926 RepID=UPI0039E62442